MDPAQRIEQLERDLEEARERQTHRARELGGFPTMLGVPMLTGDSRSASGGRRA